MAQNVLRVIELREVKYDKTRRQGGGGLPVVSGSTAIDCRAGGHDTVTCVLLVEPPEPVLGLAAATLSLSPSAPYLNCTAGRDREQFRALVVDLD